MVNNQNQQLKNLEDVESIKNLYPDLINMMASSDTSLIIERIVDTYELEKPGEFEEKLKEVKTLKESFEIIQDLPGTKIAQILRRVFLGKLHPKDLSRILQKELKIKEGLARSIADDINEQIFTQVRTSLNKLYKIKEVPPPIPEKPEEIIPPEKPTPKRPDIYREPIE